MPEPIAQQTLEYGTTTIHYRLERRQRRTLGIEVHPNGDVLVLAPADAPLETIRARVLRRAAWILRQRREFVRFPPPQPERRFVAGETHRYLGKQYRLGISIGTPESVKLLRGFLQVVAIDQTRVPVLVERWLRSRAKIVFAERVTVCLERITAFGVIHSGNFKVKRMGKRWGSCTAGGTIYLNPLLIRAPKECIDYVITHELVHTVHLHHRREFYALLSRCCPDWRTVRAKLNAVVELPHLDG
jgi:predicted metal-dependent hydrolase